MTLQSFIIGICSQVRAYATWSQSRRPSTMNSLSTPITRPTSSASVRPSSSAQLRPPSSASTLRPSSSLGSNRPISRLSQRPGSRLSRRPSLKQASRITPLTQALVTQITGITAESDADNFRIATEYVIKNLETSIGGSSGQDMSKMDQHFYGYYFKIIPDADTD